MENHEKSTLTKVISLFFLSMPVWLYIISPIQAIGGPYLDSAHGNSTAGVDRISTSALGYAVGNCAHCHEQHASVKGATSGPYNYTLFYLNFDYTAGTPPTFDTVCFQCHDDVGAVQTGGGIFNYSYSYRAGGWTSDPVNDILESFGLASFHNLDNILTFIQAQSWGYTANSNPCVACHNPHSAQGDPLDSAAAKSSATRGWPLSRPSEHTNSPWDLWGNDYTAGIGNGERMDNYTANYQAPYRYYTTTPASLEPVGDPLASPAIAAQNTTDFVTFCTDCHNAINVIYSDNLGRNLRTIDWDNEKHGKGDADIDIQALSPYTSGAGSLGYVLSCLDCHEPHGSPNIFLLRMETNGQVLSGNINDGFDFGLFCERCHDDRATGGFGGSDPWEDVHHENPDRAYNKSGSCGSCHPGFGTGQHDCSRCHFHGAVTGSDGIETCTDGAAIRRTF